MPWARRRGASCATAQTASSSRRGTRPRSPARCGCWRAIHSYGRGWAAPARKTCAPSATTRGRRASRKPSRASASPERAGSVAFTRSMRFAVFQSRPIQDRPALTGRLARRLALPVMLLALLSIVPAARADVGATIIERCTHGQSLSGFSQQDYRRALQELPAEVEEYSDCANLIRRAQLAAARGGPSAGGEGLTPLALSPAERAALGDVLK